MEKVSIIITCFNQGKLVEESIMSALNQTYRNVQAVVVDDGSSDGETVLTLKRLDEEHENLLLIRQENKGVSNARNNGLYNADGEYVVFLDGDDILSEKYIEQTFKALKKTNAKMAFSHTKLFGNINRIWYLEEPDYERMLIKNMIPLTCLISKKDACEIGGFCEEFTKGIEDWDFWVRFFKSGDRVARVNSPLFFYRQQIDSRNAKMKKSNKDTTEMIKLLHEHNSEIYKSLDQKKKNTLSGRIKRSKPYRFISYHVLRLTGISVFEM